MQCHLWRKPIWNLFSKLYLWFTISLKKVALEDSDGENRLFRDDAKHETFYNRFTLLFLALLKVIL